MASKARLPPLQTPRASAKLGMNNAPANHAAKLCQSGLAIARTPTPPPVKSATITPAVHRAGSWRERLRSEENSKASVATGFATAHLRPQQDRPDPGGEQESAPHLGFGRDELADEHSRGAGVPPPALAFEHQAEFGDHDSQKCGGRRSSARGREMERR